RGVLCRSLLHEEGRGFFQDLPLLLEQEHPPAQLAQLLALVAGQAIALAALDLPLLHPQPQRLPRYPEIPRDLPERAISPRVERHRLTPKLRRIGLSVLRLPWHGQTAFLPGRIAQRSAVHETGGIPLHLLRIRDLDLPARQLESIVHEARAV